MFIAIVESTEFDRLVFRAGFGKVKFAFNLHRGEGRGWIKVFHVWYIDHENASWSIWGNSPKKTLTIVLRKHLCVKINILNVNS
jgi:hypothetical protein